MSGLCDHEWYRDHLTRVTFMTCYCYCGLCWDYAYFQSEGNGCIDQDCFCRLQPNSNCRVSTPTHVYSSPTVEKLPQHGSKPVETVVKDLPEAPGKTGTCRECKAPTYRKGERGRFPVLCEGCKNT